VIAIKRLSSAEQGTEEFTNEVLLIMELQHKNVVKLLGFCADNEKKILVYEYMSNGSLDVILSVCPMKQNEILGHQYLTYLSKMFVLVFTARSRETGKT